MRMAGQKNTVKLSMTWKIVISIVLLAIVLILAVSISDAIRQYRVSESLDKLQQSLQTAGFASAERSGGCGRTQGKLGPGRLTCGQGVVLKVASNDEEEASAHLSVIIGQIENLGSFELAGWETGSPLSVGASGPSSVGGRSYNHKATGAQCTVSYSYQAEDARISVWIHCGTPFRITSILP